MKILSLTKSKALLAFCNFLLMVCGCTLITGGLLVLFDSGKILLSRLLSVGPLTSMPHPLLYYIAIGVTSVGLVIVGIGIIGCWASCLHSYFLLTFYFLIIMIILVGECAIYAISWIWPHCLGLDLDKDELITSLQSNYGVSGQEQFTAAIDLTQTKFNCCGISSANEYDTSLWRLQSLGPNKFAVPLTCCILNNFRDAQAYLNPIPINSTLCQALESTRHEGLRNNKGCIEELEKWYKEQYIIFLVAGLVVVLAEFLVLLSTIFAFTKICKSRQTSRGSGNNIKTKYPNTTENIYQRRSPFTLGDLSYASTSNSFKRNYKLADNT
ncbi:hypothetical protein RN001_006333 [Aquatica leii]|uniref:Tetraspanin n=1 Tax=Aquatica leii TaxID=1421715 RepID=A0AAN7PDJ2_9COLE|nr:hypothetical protein RN001_006333 [Aquatica leii]